MKQILVSLLKENGFKECPIESELHQSCNGLILQRDWAKETDVVWYGKHTEIYSVRVFVNQNSGICHVSYFHCGRECKDRWYNTVGKRTYNAIVETASNAGFEF